MANWSNPTLTSLYTDFVTEVKNRDVDLALGLDPATTSPTNVPANAIRWNSASFKYQKWDGSTWNDLSAKYIFTAVEVSGSTVPVNGMYLSTTNTLNFSTASTASRLTIDGSGNVNIDSGTFYVDAVNNRVGVGTTGPATLLDLSSTTSAKLNLTYPGFGIATLASDSTGALLLRADEANTQAGSLIQFKVDGTERLRLDASGNLGVANTSPSSYDADFRNLVIGTSGSTGISIISGTASNGTLAFGDGTGAANYRGYIQYNHTSDSLILGTAGSERARIDSSGRLLIGQTGTGLQAARSLAWQGSGEGTLYMSHSTSDGNGDPYIRFGYNANQTGSIVQAGNTGIGLTSVDYLALGAGNSEKARIDSSGYMQGTVNGLSAGRIPAKQYYRLDSARNGANQAAAQSVFGVGVTLVGSTVYEFEALYWLQCSSASGSPTMNFLFGGTATLNNIMYSGVGPGSTSVLPPASFYDAAPTSFITNVATASTVSGTLTSAVSVVYLIKGTVSVNAGGTFIPQYSFDVAPGNLFTTNAGSYFSIWPLAASGSAVNIGSWA